MDKKERKEFRLYKMGLVYGSCTSCKNPVGMTDITAMDFNPL
jgi:hypothetical protein